MKLKDLIKDNILITQEELAKEVGISRQTIWNILNDKQAPSLLTIKKICKYFNVDYKDYV